MLHSHSCGHLKQVDELPPSSAGLLTGTHPRPPPINSRPFAALNSAKMSLEDFSKHDKAIEKALVQQAQLVVALNENLDTAKLSADLRMLSDCFSVVVWYKAMEGRQISEYIDRSDFFDMCDCEVKKAQDLLSRALNDLGISPSEFEAIIDVPFDGDFSVGSYDQTKDEIINGLNHKLTANMGPSYASCIDAIVKHKQLITKL